MELLFNIIGSIFGVGSAGVPAASVDLAYSDTLADGGGGTQTFDDIGQRVKPQVDAIQNAVDAVGNISLPSLPSQTQFWMGAGALIVVLILILLVLGKFEAL